MKRVSEGRPREERAEFIIASASSRYVAGKMAWETEEVYRLCSEKGEERKR